ncbi:exosortase B [Janthinobacterium agaricidamnosum]|uniref:Eight transmembrane EpsH family protein n=1 Tax=Janthinobacterium agaricidamnosum NBRC 102515 = DSM 9628 TaxID=1349767 RepID=W0V705_9BURK|nr:exosortase B [Janthinobacterium agaricidamnosum]CDG84609.1 eight transmembrane EpsH family protein [Janthinobacterium agaricidamnosum NBRC 102515 = DSM 9628]
MSAAPTAEQGAAALPLRPSLPPLRDLLLEWLPIAVGFLTLFIPSFYTFATDIWGGEDQAHSPIILGLSFWLIYRRRAELLASRPQGVAWLGWSVFVLGMLLYIAGRSQQILAFEMASFIVVSAALILIKFGNAAFRKVWFAFFFMLFMIPLPSAVVAMLTMPMKMAVSYATEHLLFWLGYPIARSGVILQIGQYQLLVADACAGLQTLLALESLGLFYLNVVQHTSAFRNITLAILIVPISFIANVTRVVALTLITYYFGDAAGQGFLHGFAGMVLFVSALILILSLDTLLQWLVRRRQTPQVAAKEVSP